MSELDLDAIEAREAEVMERGFYPSSRWSTGSVLSDVRVLIAELRRLREENAMLRTALSGLLSYHDKCGMESSYGVYSHEVLEGLPKPPEVE